MVVTSLKLQDNMGLNPIIADYFTNKRQIPVNNLFWEKKRVYISNGFGFLIIPMFFDLTNRMGVSADLLLNDEHVSLMEQGLHNSEMYENGEISFDQFLTSCKNLLKGKIKQAKLASDLFDLFSGSSPKYFTFETKHRALTRSDSFLFTLVDLDLSDEWVEKFIPLWYSLVRPILLYDDFNDLIEDRQNKEENTIIELGNNANAIKKAYQIGVDDLTILSTVHPKLAEFMKGILDKALILKHIQAELNS